MHDSQMQCGESLETGLHRAAFKGFVDVVQFLLSVGVDPGVQDKNVRALNPLVFFLATVTHMNNEQGDRAIHSAVRNGHLNVLEAFLIAGVSTELQGREVSSPNRAH